MLTLKELAPGETGVVKAIGAAGLLRKRLLELGITTGTTVYVRKTAPLGDPIELCLRGYELVLRRKEAECIWVERQR